MFKNILSIFIKKSKSNIAPVKSIQPIENASSGKIKPPEAEHSVENNRFDDITEDEIFSIDFISIRESQETITNARVIFPFKNQYIIINEHKDYFDAYYVNDEGMSSDNLYHRIATPDYKFWLFPKDYRRFMSVANHRRNILLKNRQKRNERTKTDIHKSFDYNPIDKSIYKCFISNKTGMCDAIGTWEQFYKIENEISKICEENGGKYYKSPAKSATFAIIFDPNSRVYSNVSDIKAKGYKVTTFEKALEYFSLSEMWNCDRHSKFEKEYKKYMKDTDE